MKQTKTPPATTRAKFSPGRADPAKPAGEKPKAEARGAVKQTPGFKPATRGHNPRAAAEEAVGRHPKR
jgi:hypothetical protein